MGKLGCTQIPNLCCCISEKEKDECHRIFAYLQKKNITEYLQKTNITEYLQKKNVTEFLQKRNITEYLQKRMSQRWSCFNALQLNCTSTAVLFCSQRKILQGTLLLSSSCSKSKFSPKLKQRCMSHCGAD